MGKILPMLIRVGAAQEGIHGRSHCTKRTSRDGTYKLPMPESIMLLDLEMNSKKYIQENDRKFP